MHDVSDSQGAAFLQESSYVCQQCWSAAVVLSAREGQRTLVGLGHSHNYNYYWPERVRFFFFLLQIWMFTYEHADVIFKVGLIFKKMSKLSTVGQACCPNYSEDWGKDHLHLRVQDKLGQYGKIPRKRWGVKKGGRKEGRKGKKKENKETKIESTTKGCRWLLSYLARPCSWLLPWLRKADDRGTSLLARRNGVGCVPTYRQSLCSHPRTLSSWKRWRDHKTQKVRKSAHM